MVAAARRDGVHLWTEECYRDFAAQVAVRNWWCNQGNCKTYGTGSAASLPPGGDPVGSFDLAQGSTAGNPLIHLAGWTIDPDTEVPTDVHIYVDGRLRNSSAASRVRGDLGATYPLWGASHGFDKWLTTTPGSHQVCVWAINEYRSGVNINLGCRNVTVA